ncbi:MAG: amino acid permease [Bacilli bacterium]|nr:amino acid permease [Bacilli bacterium]
MEKKKKFKLFDAILATVCITLVVESTMPTAAIGNSQYFWWLLLLIAFCLPYGMISAELSTAYPSEAGMYDWVKRAFGKKWAGRVAWNYWINFPLWIASLATAVTTVIAGLFEVELAWWVVILIQLAYIWLTTFLGTKRVGESKYIVNLGTFFKVLVLGTLGILGFVYLAKNGSENPITSFSDLLPDLSLNIDSGLPFISIIIFNFLGFEVVGSFVGDMDNPKKDIPKALIIGGIIMAIFYILPATAFNIVLGGSSVDPEDMVQVFQGIFGAVGLSGTALKVAVYAFGFMLIYTFIANISSWSFGVDEVAKYAADDGSMPKAFKGTNKEGVASNASIMNGIVASIISVAGVVVAEFFTDFSDAFSLFFCLSWITLLLGYTPMFLAFLKLRKTDPNTERPYRVPGGKVAEKVLAIVPFVFLVLGIIFTIFGDFSVEYLQDNIPLLVGVGLSLLIQEILVFRIKK